MKLGIATLTFLLSMSLIPVQNNLSVMSAGKTGRIYGHISGGCLPVTIKIVGIDGTDYNGTFITNSAGDFETSLADKGDCILPCPGNYTVTPYKPGYDFSPLSKTIIMSQCCSATSYMANFSCREGKRGRIRGDIMGGCLPVTIKIVGINGTDYSRTFETSDRGEYDTSATNTSCVLICPGTYTVTPIKPSYTFNPPSITVQMTECCSNKMYTANFSCSTGRIYGTITGGQDPISILVEGESDTVFSKTYTTIRGFFETSTNSSSKCDLPCPGKFKVTPSKKGYIFEPQSTYVTFDKCCPDNGFKTNFVCKLSPVKFGRIYGQVKQCSYPVPVKIVGIEGTNYSGIFNTSLTGDFQSSPSPSPSDPFSCILPCPGTYIVTPMKAGYDYAPPSLRIDMKECCSKSYVANFGSKPTPKRARITGKISGVNPVSIKILDSSGTQVWIGTSNATSGYYGTTDTLSNCILKCPGTYTVIPSKTGYSFTPPTKTIVFTLNQCCNNVGGSYPGYQVANFEGKPAEGRIKVIVKGDFTDATVKILTIEATPKLMVTGTVDKKGFFDSSCKLICGKSYTVTVTPRTSCSSKSQAMKVTVKSCCPDKFETVSFSITCPKPTARIVGTVKGYCTSGVKIVIKRLDASMATITLTTDSKGNYDSGCKVPCPGKYSITPILSNSKCTFAPTSKTITIPSTMCCSSSVRVDFTSAKKQTMRGQEHGDVSFVLAL